MVRSRFLLVGLFLVLAACSEQEPPVAPAESVLHRLAEQGQTHELIRVISETGDPDERDVCYRTPLMFAAQFGRLDTVHELIAAGAQIDLTEKGNYTALMLAAGNGHTEVVRTLAEAGANIDQVEITNGWTALIWAANRGHSGTVQLLLALGADPAIRDQKGHTATDWARMQGHLELEGLLDK